MYNDINSIPSGWAICNGENETPDLTDKFISIVESGDKSIIYIMFIFYKLYTAYCSANSVRQFIDMSFSLAYFLMATSLMASVFSPDSKVSSLIFFARNIASVS